MKKVVKTDEEWKNQLATEEYYVTRQKGTDPPFSGKYCDFKGKGSFVCVCCGNDLFDSGAKFNSGTGWPSFCEPVTEDHIEEHRDYSYGMVRTEVTCARCGAHLGHVFEDGPAPTGLRYCINSVSLGFVDDDEKETGDRE